jgi:hypothetical protein
LIKALDNVCLDSADCGRTASCIYLNELDTNGKCTEYYTITDATSIYAKHEEDTFICESGYGHLTSATGEYEYLIGASFVAGNYECGKSVMSEKAGLSCKGTSDCKSNEGSITTRCGCSHGSNDTICGILPGNIEWQNYFKSVKVYYKASKDCHGARNFGGVCGGHLINDEKECMKATAKNFIYYQNAPECVKLYSNLYLYPEVSEVEEWCNPIRK